MQRASDSRVLSCLENLFTPAFACAVWKSDPPPEPVHPSEERLVFKAVLKRKSAFRAGRRAAHLALARLGRDCDAILAGAGREPLWPEGSIGSISHARPVSVAVVAPQTAVRAVGVDLESDRGLTESQWQLVFCDSELVWLQGCGQRAEQLAMTIFSAKETLFKLQYPHTGSFVDFRDVSLELIEEQEGFEARLPEFVHEALGHPAPIRGKYHKLGELILTAAWIEND